MRLVLDKCCCLLPALCPNHQLQTMPTTRAKKKARTDQSRHSAKSSKSASNRSSGNNPQLSAELIARVATYVPHFKSDEEIHSRSTEPHTYKNVFNLCLAAGPAISRSIKQSYLKKNLRYLELCQRKIGITGRPGRGGRQCLRECHLAWMSANIDWRDYVTDEVVDQCKYVPRSSSYNVVLDTTDRSKHALSGLANPARATELGLVDALRFLIEDKLIDVNAKQWQTYEWRYSPVHLLTVAINANQPEAFDYLLSLEAIDFNGDSNEHDQRSKCIFSSALEGCVEDKRKCHFFQALVQHPKFQPNGRFLYGYNPNLQAPGKMSLLTMFVNEYTSMLMGYDSEEIVKGKQKRFLHAFQLVLNAGADTRLEFDDLNSSFDIAVDNIGAASCGGTCISFGQRLVHALEQMIKMMSNRGGKYR